MRNPFEHTGDDEGRFEVNYTPGAQMIAAERDRQISGEGWTAEHDDEHGNGEIIQAAFSYTLAAHEQVAPHDPAFTVEQLREDMLEEGGELWPWDPTWFKLSDDPIRNLVKAGALIAAEIDRLQRKAKGK